jgi:hypothetical protein
MNGFSTPKYGGSRIIAVRRQRASERFQDELFQPIGGVSRRQQNVAELPYLENVVTLQFSCHRGIGGTQRDDCLFEFLGADKLVVGRGCVGARCEPRRLFDNCRLAV